VRRVTAGPGFSELSINPSVPCKTHSNFPWLLSQRDVHNKRPPEGISEVREFMDGIGLRLGLTIRLRRM
jgi:hypothetical protein